MQFQEFYVYIFVLAQINTIYIYIDIYIYTIEFMNISDHCSIVTNNCYVGDGWSSDGGLETQKYYSYQM